MNKSLIAVSNIHINVSATNITIANCICSSMLQPKIHAIKSAKNKIKRKNNIAAIIEQSDFILLIVNHNILIGAKIMSAIIFEIFIII